MRFVTFLAAVQALQVPPSPQRIVPRRPLLLGGLWAPLVALADEPFDPSAGCAKRGALGKCLDESATAPAAPPPTILTRKPVAEVPSGELYERLKKQTEENKDKNARAVQIKSWENSQAGITGPFSRFDVVQKTDESFVLVPVRTREKLEKAKKIKDGHFVDDKDALPFELPPDEIPQ